MEINWSYVAGFFDGEGHIRCDLRPEGYICPQIQITQAEPQQQVLYEIQEFLKDEGIPSRINVQTGRFGRAPLHRLVVTSQKGSLDFISGTLPWLIVKKERALKVQAAIRERLEIRSHPRWRSRFSELDARVMRKLWKLGYTQQEIGNKFMTSQVHVSRLIRSLEIPA